MAYHVVPGGFVTAGGYVRVATTWRTGALFAHVDLQRPGGTRVPGRPAGEHVGVHVGQDSAREPSAGQVGTTAGAVAHGGAETAGGYPGAAERFARPLRASPASS